MLLLRGSAAAAAAPVAAAAAAADVVASPSSQALHVSSSAVAAARHCGQARLSCSNAWVGAARGRNSVGTVRVSAGSAEGGSSSSVQLTGVVFQPFQELKSPLLQLPTAPSSSFARQRYSAACEAAINEQINVEYSASYIYHALFAYFDRDYVALPGIAHFFKESSEEEREHAEKFIKYQNLRGGKVQLHSILQPAVFEFDNEEKGDALHAMELALSLEKLTNEKLLGLHKVADENGDPQLQVFIETEYLNEQVVAIKRISEYVSQLKRVGKGHGVYHFDRVLLEHNGNGKEIA